MIKKRLKHLFWEDNWNILLIFKAKHLFLDVKLQKDKKIIIPNARGAFYADPFILQNDPLIIICEEFLFAKQYGRIVSLTLDEQYHVVEKHILLDDKKAHYSYPFVITKNGETYVIPESSSETNVVLYKYVRQIHKLEKVAVILSGKEFLDSTIVQKDGLYYLFTSTNNSNLLVYYSENLEGNYLPLENHIAHNDYFKARSAGDFFEYENKLIRPSQDCSQVYGGGLVFHEVTELNTKSYKEKIIHEIHPESLKNHGVHTYNGVEFCVIDQKKTFFSFFKPFYRFYRKLAEIIAPEQTGPATVGNQSLKFSIVVPTYNRAQLIIETIHSIINQTYVNWELIIVDDGGNDNTKEIAESFNDDRIFYFWKENAERGAARNFGVQKTTGDYIFFLDSDDIILPEYFRYASELIGLNNPECLHIPYHLFDGIMVIESGPDLKNIQEVLMISNKFACQIILRKDIALAYQFSENRDFIIGEDWYLILRLTARFKWVIGTQALGRIRQHNDRTMNSPSYKIIHRSRLIMKEELLKDQYFMDRPKVLKNVDTELQYLELFALTKESKDRKDLLKRIWKRILLKPAFLYSKRFFVILNRVILPKR